MMDADIWRGAGPLLLLMLAAARGVAALLGGPAWVARRRARLRARPFPAPWRRILVATITGVLRNPVVATVFVALAWSTIGLDSLYQSLGWRSHDGSVFFVFKKFTQ